MNHAEMSPIDWAKRPLEKYADFSGRATRSEYWWYVLATIIAYFVVMIVESIVGLDGAVGPYGVLTLLLGLALLLPGLAVTVRRLHDTNRSGWWILLWVVPYAVTLVAVGGALAAGSVGGLMGAGLLSLLSFAAAIVLIVFLVLPGTPGDNRFGPNPLGTDGATATV